MLKLNTLNTTEGPSVFQELELYNSCEVVEIVPNRTRIHPQVNEQIDEQSQLQQESKDIKTNGRQGGNIIWFIVISLCTIAVPFANLFLFQFQPVSLSRSIDKTNLSLNDAGRTTDFTFFYLDIAIYLIVISCFVAYSSTYSNWKQRLKIHFLLDNIMVTMLGTNVSYAALHIVNFTGSYSTDFYLQIQVTYDIYAEDIIVIILYCLANLTLAGCFRILIANVNWNSCQIIIYKITVVLCSLGYIGIGFIYITGINELSAQASQFNTEIIMYIDDYIYADPSYLLYLDLVTWLEREATSLNSVISQINNFVVLYVFTNFALFYQFISKITEFDQTTDLKTYYQLKPIEQ